MTKSNFGEKGFIWHYGSQFILSQQYQGRGSRQEGTWRQEISSDGGQKLLTVLLPGSHSASLLL